MDFTVDYRPTPDEVMRAFEQALKRRLKVFLWLLPTLPAALGIISLLLSTSSAVGIGLLVTAALTPFVATWSLRRTARPQIDHLCVPGTLHMTDDHYEWRTEQVTTTMRWSLFDEIVTGPEFWLLFIKRQPAAFLPRRAFSPEQQAELDARLSARP
ncbi:YcxB-like protein [Nonomuraea solani]|uniref:YcxB-like protein n=1 Tax=Nonomuraea solani TaxID=1144553 RepID=A0A1H6D449_9ACTN|nr:YcxB family protein [Nonomuraea solani]SEG80107.1 YcxB-like protein [Nonomuraea solani]